MPANNHRTQVTLALATAILLWASSFPVIRSAVDAYPHPGAMALLRFSVASLVLALYVLCTHLPHLIRQRRVHIKSQARGRLLPKHLAMGRATCQFLPSKKQLPIVFLCGLLGISLYHPLLNYGEKTVSAGAASLLINSAPLWTALLAVPLLREHFTRRKTLGAITGFVGIILITLGKQDPTDPHATFQPAALCIVGSAICTSLYVILQKKFLHLHSALQFTAWTIWAGTLLMAPIFGYELATTLPHAQPKHIAEIVYLGIFPAALAYLTFSYATKKLPAARVMSFLYLVPPLAMLLAWIYPSLHEVPTLTSLLGGTLAIAGVAIVNATAPQKPTPTPVAIEEA